MLTAAMLASTATGAGNTVTDTITVDLNKREADIQPSMYGVFFEEINHSGDGGLYAEMVRNRSFEDLRLYNGWNVRNVRLYARAVRHHITGLTDRRRFGWPGEKVPGWNLTGSDGIRMTLTTENPMFASAPTSLRVDMGQGDTSAVLTNGGFWGMAFRKGESYRLRVIMRTATPAEGRITARLLSSDGRSLAETVLRPLADRQWTDTECLLAARGDTDSGRLALELDGCRTIWLDYVSLFPVNTFRRRPGGLRADLAETIAALRPAFVRWPGGSIVGGITLDNRFDWKKSLGDPAARPGEYITWGYRTTYGLGYYEMLQFCEDIGADAMYVCNVGMSDLFRSGELADEDSVAFFVTDCLHAIEYALGDSTTEWGARRAADGHPEPFPLRYVEIGNEHWGEVYDRRVDSFYTAIKNRWPGLTLISNHYTAGTGMTRHTDMIDPHWYGRPECFFANTAFFDSVPRGAYTAYVGEYACNTGVGTGNMRAALAEAAFIGGMERNGDFVRMTSYAPLLQNRNDRDWPVNLIWFDTDSIVCRSSYYVQQMAAENRPDFTVGVSQTHCAKPVAYASGRIGLGSTKTLANIKDITITSGGRTAVLTAKDGKAAKGSWNDTDGMMSETSGKGGLWLTDSTFGTEFTLTCKMRKHTVKEGLLVGFGFSDDGRYGYTYNVGCWNGRSADIERYERGITTGNIGLMPECIVEPDRWHDVKIAVTPCRSDLWVDGRFVMSHVPMSVPEQFVTAGIDRKAGELILKVVNRSAHTYRPTIRINGTAEVNPVVRAVTLSGVSDREENSFAAPHRIRPINSVSECAGRSFEYEFKPYSFTVLRIGAIYRNEWYTACRFKNEMQ